MVDRTKYFQPGDLIYSCEPFVSIVRSEVLREYCEGCFKRELNLKRCASCKYVSYCGTKCQKKSWQDHQMECKYLHRLPKVGKDYTRILGKIILKVQGRNLKDIADRVGPHLVHFDDISCGSGTKLAPYEENLRYLQYANLLKEYLGEKNLPEETVLKKIIDKTIQSLEYLIFLETETAKIRLDVYIGITMFAHSCIPNATCVQIGNKREVRAISEISKSNWKSITVTRIFIINNLGDRMNNPILKNCKCTDCSAPYGESVLTKILDKKNAFFVLQESRNIFKLMEMCLRLKVAVPDILLRINTLLQKQEGILADTNILRLKLLFMKCHYLKNDAYELKANLKKLHQLIVRVFGKYSEEQILTLTNLHQINFQLGCTNEAMDCVKKMEDLKKIHYGQNISMPSAAANTPIELQNFFREVLINGQQLFEQQFFGKM